MSEALCKIDDCSHETHGYGLCQQHYMRWRRHGDPLGGRASSALLKMFLAKAVCHGAQDDCLIWPYGKDKDGYGKIARASSPRHVHRLVCEAKHGAPPTPHHHAAHSCGKGHLGCVNPHHLSWKTPAENIADQIVHGTRVRGHKQHSSKLTEDDVLSIHKMKGQLPQRKLATIYGVNQAAISAIHRGKNWSWLTQQA